MRLTTAFGIGLLCFGASHAQDRESDLIRSVRKLPVGTLDPSYIDRDNPLERYLGIYARVAVPSIEWRVTDCGEEDNGAETPTCVEGLARTAPDITMVVSVEVADSAQQAATFTLHGFFVTQGNVTTRADSLVQFATLAVRTTPLREPIPTSAGGITEVMVERTWCFGRCPIDTLELHADGRAVYAGKQHTQRTGHFAGTLPISEFNVLAQWLIAEGFFQLRGSYGEPNVDTPTQVLRITRDGQQTWVVNNSIRRSLDVLAMGRVVSAVAEEYVNWQPVQSGIRGVALRKPPGAGETWQPLSSVTFTVNAPDEEHGFVIRADAEGRFELPLLPESYRIETTVPFGPARTYPSETLTVRPDQFTEVSFRVDNETGTAEFVINAADASAR